VALLERRELLERERVHAAELASLRSAPASRRCCSSRTNGRDRRLLVLAGDLDVGSVLGDEHGLR
jgi:hypothetical protein